MAERFRAEPISSLCSLAFWVVDSEAEPIHFLATCSTLHNAKVVAIALNKLFRDVGGAADVTKISVEQSSDSVEHHQK